MADLTEVYSALEKADAAGDTSGAKQLADYIRGQNGEQPMPQVVQQVQPQSNPYGFGDFLKDTASGIARPIANAITSMPLMAMDAGVQARAFIENPHIPTLGQLNPFSAEGRSAGPYTLPSEMYRQSLDSVTRAPSTMVGRLAEMGSSMLAGFALTQTGMIPQAEPKLFATDRLAPQSFVAPSERPNITGAQERAIYQGRELGLRTTPGQEVGNKALQQFEAKLESSPWTSGPFNRLAQRNIEGTNEAWAKAIGQEGKTVDLEAANARLGTIFENARSPSSILYTNPENTKAVLDKIDTDFEGLLPIDSVRSNPLVSKLEDLTTSGSVDAKQLGNMSSKLGRLAFKNMTGSAGDRELGQAVYAVKDHVDDLLQSTMSGDEAVTYAAARQEYRALMQLTSRVGNVNPSTGNVSAGSIASYLQQSDKRGFTFGANQSDAYNAARFAQAFKPVVGNSGTATRMFPDLKDMALSVPGGMFSRMYLSSMGRGAVNSLLSPSVSKPDDYLGVLNAIPQIGLAGAWQ